MVQLLMVGGDLVEYDPGIYKLQAYISWHALLQHHSIVNRPLS